MSVLRFSWKTPTVHASGRPVSPGEVIGYDLQVKVDGAPSFTTIASLGPTATSFEIDQPVPGDYSAQLVVKASNGTTTTKSGSISISDTTPLVLDTFDLTLA